jgi:hypothetical protein|tara:strand:- start:2860 stop:3465 length:606 start_codon:yes stop_codon:yes gene_type:complete
MELLTQNSKIKATSKELGVKLMNFGITAYKSLSGRMICPWAGPCTKYCYAQKGAYSWSNVKPAFEKRYEATLRDDFIEVMSAEITRKKPDYVRVHDSGDYYSRAYRDKWYAISKRFPNIRFYSYTNSLNLIRESEIPENFDFIFSDGGKLADTIDQSKERHSKVFKTYDEMEAQGYTNASKMDLFATKWYSPSHKVGLIFH